MDYTPSDSFKESNLYNHAINEGVTDSCVLELLEVFSKQGHSGASAAYCISLFEKLASFKAIGPLYWRA